MYIHMLGYPTHFGQMECVNLVAEQSYAEKVGSEVVVYSTRRCSAGRIAYCELLNRSSAAPGWVSGPWGKRPTAHGRGCWGCGTLMRALHHRHGALEPTYYITLVQPRCLVNSDRCLVACRGMRTESSKVGVTTLAWAIVYRVLSTVRVVSYRASTLHCTRRYLVALADPGGTFLLCTLQIHT